MAVDILFDFKTKYIMGLMSETEFGYEGGRNALPQIPETDRRFPLSGTIFEQRRNDGFPRQAHLQAQRLRLEDEIFEDREEAFTSFTIDGEYSKDLDDSIGLEKTEDGYRLHVSIADVSSLVTFDSPIDKEARRRSFTEYLSWGNKPMIPRVLSEDRLSLHQGQKRPTITVTIPISNSMEIGEPGIRKTFLVSSKRFSYTEVDHLLKNGNSEYGDVLKECDRLASNLSERRKKRGATVVFDLEKGIGTSEEGIVREMPDEEAYEADRIIREFMILTNETVARYFRNKGIPTLFRNHDSLGFRAYYDPAAKGHAGLGLLQETPYLHFTSPIRRLPDLITHRQLLANVDGNNLPYNTTDLEEIATIVNQKEEEIRQNKPLYMLSKENRNALNSINSGNFGQLNFVEFTRVIRVAVRGGLVREDLQEEILKRLSEGKLRHKDILFLLTRSTSEEIKENIFSWLNKTPGVINDILGDLEKDYGVSKSIYTTSKENKGFVTAGWQSEEIYIESEPFKGACRKISKRLAGVNLVRKTIAQIKLLKEQQQLN